MYALVKHIIKTHKKHVASRRADINRYRAYASRDLSSGMYGNDVDRMTDLLVENDVLNAWDRTVSHKWSHIKYNRKVKNSVKRMQARMGRKKTGKASKTFLMSLQQWKDTKNKLTTAFSKDSLDLKENHDALLAVAILLVEKGYMKNYYADDIRNQGVGECDHFLRPLDFDPLISSRTIAHHRVQRYKEKMITPNSSGGKLHYVIVFMKKISKLEGIMSTTP